ncbi:MAG: acyltransferase family protein, partial [Clostridium sp.]
MDKKIYRIYYLDVLRIISILGVILIHDTASNVANLSHIGSESWWVANILNASFRWAVPIFFMISGALLANKEESLKDLFG